MIRGFASKFTSFFFVLVEHVSPVEVTFSGEIITVCCFELGLFSRIILDLGLDCSFTAFTKKTIRMFSHIIICIHDQIARKTFSFVVLMNIF